MNLDFERPMNTAREHRTVVNMSKVQLLQPVMGMLLEPNESAIVNQTLTVELDPIPGRLLTPITAEVFSVFVPMQAVDALVDGTEYAGITEVIRNKLVSGNAMFVVENENEITQRMDIKPMRNGGLAKVNAYARYAHNAAVNYLRRRLHRDAVQLAHGNMAVTPALLSSTSLDRLNAVLNPESRINGAVSLQLPTLSLPVSGSATVTRAGTNPAKIVNAATGANLTNSGTDYALQVDGTTANLQNLSNVNAALDPNGSLVANLAGATALLNGVTAGNVSLDDFYNAETMDRLTRKMGEIMEANPELGQELILRWVHGLGVDNPAQPWLLYKATKFFNRNVVGATDTAGVNADTVRTDMAQVFAYSFPVPPTELGGFVVTFLQVKPDETLGSQPHPVLGKNFFPRNFAADMLKLDPVPVTMRELNSDVAQASENTVAMYTGLNELKRNYVTYGFGRNVNPATLANKYAVWQLEIPLSVTPTSVLHPAPDQDIFADTLGEPVKYICEHMALIKTPVIFGPTPVEDLPVLDTSDIFDQVP